MSKATERTKIATQIGEDFLLVFRAAPDEPGGPNAIQRLRMLLKYAGRTLRLRCITCAPDVRVELPPPAPGLDPTTDEPEF